MSIFDLFERISRPRGGIEYLIVGLGNPGPKYADTRHNAGFRAMDEILARNGLSADRNRFQSLCAEGEIAGKRCLLLKPQTFMNKSGEAVSAAVRFYKIPPEKVIVLFDDVSLSPGSVRIRRRGSAGGHNGIRSVIEHLDSEEFPRVKLGVGKKPHPDYDLADWVLSVMKPDERKKLDEVCALCPEIVEYLVGGKIEEAMNRFSH